MKIRLKNYKARVEKLEQGLDISLEEIEAKAIKNLDIIETTQLGGRDNSRAKRKD